MGAGAIAVVPLLPRLRARFSRDQLVTWRDARPGSRDRGDGVAPNVYVGVACMLVAGFVWIAVATHSRLPRRLRFPIGRVPAAWRSTRLP
jgi:hypothetical protein